MKRSELAAASLLAKMGLAKHCGRRGWTFFNEIMQVSSYSLILCDAVSSYSLIIKAMELMPFIKKGALQLAFRAFTTFPRCRAELELLRLCSNMLEDVEKSFVSQSQDWLGKTLCWRKSYSSSSSSSDGNMQVDEYVWQRATVMKACSLENFDGNRCCVQITEAIVEDSAVRVTWRYTGSSNTARQFWRHEAFRLRQYIKHLTDLHGYFMGENLSVLPFSDIKTIETTLEAALYKTKLRKMELLQLQDQTTAQKLAEVTAIGHGPNKSSTTISTACSRTNFESNAQLMASCEAAHTSDDDDCRNVTLELGL